MSHPDVNTTLKTVFIITALIVGGLLIGLGYVLGRLYE